MWEIEVTDQFTAWYDALSDDDARAVNEAVDVLEGRGPALGRPLVDAIKASRHANMKELRPLSTSIRILLAFDPRPASCVSRRGAYDARRHLWGYR